MASDLIDRLAADATPMRRTGFGLLLTWLAAALLVSVVYILTVGMRPDIAEALLSGALLRKAAVGALVACGSLMALDRLARPGVPRDWRGAALLGLALLAVLVPALLQWSRDGMSAPVASAMGNPFGWDCLEKMVLASVAPWLAVLAWLRRMAPVNLSAASLAAGGVCVGTGILAYVLHCPFDEPSFVLLWYSAAIGVVTGVTRLVLPALIRW